VGKNLLAEKVDTFITSNKTIEFVMLGFPCKSKNSRDKVFGTLPDLGELLSFQNFTAFNDEIKKFHAPGVNFNVCTDGFVFNELLQIPDNVVYDYKAMNMDYSKGMPITWFDLTDFYEKENLNNARTKLSNQFGVSEEKLSSEILLNPDVNYLYKGMIIFMTQELAINNYVSGNQLHKAAKALTRQMMFANEAYSNLVRHNFSHCVRLSMHPSINNGNKYSFQLIKSKRADKSAWHCVILKDGKEYVTMHKKMRLLLATKLNMLMEDRLTM
jgi:pyoverdine/dityrosine biosynthesis protein Dit1